MLIKCHRFAKNNAMMMSIFVYSICESFFDEIHHANLYTLPYRFADHIREGTGTAYSNCHSANAIANLLIENSLWVTTTGIG
jgi:hypothetical protein